MEKIKSLLKSRRFWLAVASVAAVGLNETLGLSEEEVMLVAGTVIAWIIGDSVRATK